MPSTYIYGLVRDRILMSSPHCDVSVYFNTLMSIQTGSLDPRSLFKHIRHVATNYEAARKRALYSKKVFPELSVYFMACLYYSKLPDSVQQVVPSPCSWTLDPKKRQLDDLLIAAIQAYDRIIHRSARNENPQQQTTSNLTAAAV